MKARWLVWLGVCILFASIGVGCTRPTTTVPTKPEVLYGAGKGEGLLIFDVKDSASPAFVRNIPVAGGLEKVIVQGNYAYLACGYQGLTIMDTTDPLHPVQAGHVSTAGFAANVYVVGDILYLIDRDNGVLLIRLKDGKDPTLISKITFPVVADSYEHQVHAVAQVEDTLYVTTQRALHIFNIATLEKPVKIDSLEMSSGGEMMVQDKHLFVQDYGQKLRLYKITDPKKPKEIAKLELSTDYQIIHWMGNKLITLNTEKNLIEIYDIQTPEKPTKLGSYQSSKAMGVIGNGDDLYVLKGFSGLDVVDISNPARPMLVQTYDYGICALDLIKHDHYLYILDKSAGLLIFDVSHPTAVKKIGSYRWDPTEWADWREGASFEIHGDYAYIADGDLLILDVSDPTKIQKVGEYHPKEKYASIEDVAVTEGFAYAAVGEWGLHVIDVTDPARPVKVDEYFDPTWEYEGETEDDSGNSFITSVEIRDHTLYTTLYSHWGILLGNGDAQLLTFDISEPGAIRESAYSQLFRDCPTDLQVQGETVYIVDPMDGIIPISKIGSEISWPVGLAGLQNPYAIHVTPEKIAYVSTAEAVIVLNLQDLENVQWLSQIQTVKESSSIYTDGDYAYVAKGQNGFTILDIKDPAHPVVVNDIPWIHLDQAAWR